MPSHFAGGSLGAGCPPPTKPHVASRSLSLGVRTAQSSTLDRHFGLWTRMFSEAQTHFCMLYPAGTTAHKLVPVPCGDAAPRPVAGSRQARPDLPTSHHRHREGSCTRLLVHFMGTFQSTLLSSKAGRRDLLSQSGILVSGASHSYLP